MIGSLRGPVTHVGQEFVLVELGGVGYRVVAGPSLLARLRAGREAPVFIHHLVREDQQALFGFATTEELAFFELLMTVTGSGPAWPWPSPAHPVTKLQLAIVTDDADVSHSVSGGPQDGAADHPGAQGEGPRRRDRGGGGRAPTRTSSPRSSRSATPREARRAAGAVAGDQDGLDLRIKAALQELARSR